MVDSILSLTIFFGSLALLFLLKKFKIWKKIFVNREQTRRALIEDILKQLFHVEYSKRTASLNDMAGALKIANDKLVAVVEKMSVSNLIEIAENTISLTSAGRDYALRIIRVHRLWETHLSERTGIDKSEWHNLAELKEHVLTPEQGEKIYQELGSPRFDPHGDPIPTESGELMESDRRSLSSMTIENQGLIVHIEDEPEVIYKQIIEKKLHIGSKLKILNADEHQIQFYCEGNVYSLSLIVASNIHIHELSKDELLEESQIRLSSLNGDEKASVVGISSECRGASRRRLLDLGFIKGTPIKVEYPGPMKNPKAYLIRNTLIALRNDQAELILIEKE